MTGYQEVRLVDLVDEIGEDEVQNLLADYLCPLNLDVEDFLRNKAILFAKQGYAQTFLIYTSYKGVPTLAGYYALANKSITVPAKNLNSKWRSRIKRFAKYDDDLKCYPISLPLIGQIGKNFTRNAERLISGNEILEMACNRVKAALAVLGGKMVYLECEDKPRLIAFYENNGFYRFANRNLDRDELGEMRYLVQMIRYFK